jgi:hypothetical protein
MLVYPDMNIRFPETREADLVEGMKSRAQGPWRWRDVPRKKDYLFFDRDAAGPDPVCTLAIDRREPGNWIVVNITPQSKVEHGRLSVEQYVGLLQDFDRQIAEPAAEELGGLTSIDAHERRLADYFSPRSLELLQRFCETSNVSTLGSHPSDQWKWMSFLLNVHRSGELVYPHLFGALLKAERWWPAKGIRRLVNEYELAMELLRLEDRTRLAL